nr:radical SAM protein [Candidatus Wukongarchaeota archaeon]
MEVAFFAQGCCFRCPSCQNWHITYASKGELLTPKEAAIKITEYRKINNVDRMAISGGESTLNKPWLLQYIKEVKNLNKDDKARVHVDTNGAILTPDYIDALLEKGMTDIGIDVKGLEIETFMKITNLHDKELAKRYFETEWNSVKYIIDNYWGDVFLGLGIPYNPALISLEEVRKIGEKIAKWEPNIQVCALDYRPEFRAKHLIWPTIAEMMKVKEVLDETGLKNAMCQTKGGHIGP